MAVQQAYARLPYINVQPDYPAVIRDVAQSVVKAESFWASAYLENETSVHGKISCERDQDGDLVTRAREGVKIHRIGEDETSFKLSFPSLGIPPTLITKPRQQILSSLSNFPQQLNSFDVSATLPLLVLGGDDGELTVIDYKNHETKPLILKGCVGDILETKFFPSGEVILSAALSGALYVHSAVRSSTNMSTPARTLLAHVRPVTSVSILGRGRQILSGSKDGTLKRWDVGKGVVVGNLSVPGGRDEIWSVDVAVKPGAEGGNEGEMEEGWVGLASGKVMGFRLVSDGSLEWSGKVIEGRQGDGVTALACCPTDPSLLLTGTSQGFINLYQSSSSLITTTGNNSVGSLTSLTTLRRSSAATTSIAWMTDSDTSFVIGSEDGMPFICHCSHPSQQATIGSKDISQEPVTIPKESVEEEVKGYMSSEWKVREELTGFEDPVRRVRIVGNHIWAGGKTGVFRY
ncbi:WD40 repeat-containing protein [Phaffia rhodozyma]|uniref:WD40 repeat-containing protein n=1 Tax=Phaffia rhodozyma TaxID=264483 RepID=A0A0F7SEN4_PHARH|nr:WD40 repeat-containing protein [Phaffia rhodozyma]